MTKADASGNTLTYRDTQIIKGILSRGDHQHDIAAYFGIDTGRIAEVATGNCAYPNAPPAKARGAPAARAVLDEICSPTSD